MTLTRHADAGSPPRPPATPKGPPARGRRVASARHAVRLPLAPSLERRRLQVHLVLLVADGLAIFTGFALAGFIYFGDAFDSGVMLQAQLVLPIYWTVAIGNGAYSAASALNARTGGLRAVLAMVAAVAILVFLAYVLKSSQVLSRMISVLGTISAIGFLLLARDELVRFGVWRCGPTALNQLVINDGGRRIDLPHAYMIDAGEHGLVPDIGDPHAMNRIGLFLRNMDRVIISCAPERRREWATILKGAHIEAEIVDPEVVALGAVSARRTSQYGALVIAAGPLGLRNRVLKRALDLALALGALVLLAPVLALVAAAIRLEDGGPVLFVQRRMGRGNRFFRIYKSVR